MVGLGLVLCVVVCVTVMCGDYGSASCVSAGYVC